MPACNIGTAAIPKRRGHAPATPAARQNNSLPAMPKYRLISDRANDGTGRNVASLTCFARVGVLRPMKNLSKTEPRIATT